VSNLDALQLHACVTGPLELVWLIHSPSRIRLVAHALVRSGSSHSSLPVVVRVAAVLAVGVRHAGEAGGDAGGDGVPEVERVAEALVDPQ
jgi:hypothetical protein